MTRLAIMLVCVLLAACGDNGQEEAKEGDARETPFDPLTDPLDRAKAVEGTVEQHKRELDEALEKAEERDERR